VEKTPLENWLASKISSDVLRKDFSRTDLSRYQLGKLRETIEYVQFNSPFYRRHLVGLSRDRVDNLEDLRHFPFTAPEHLREKGTEFLCVSQSEIERVVTLQLLHTTAKPIRVYFTAEDVELTIDFFHHGMSTLVKPGQKVLILMPGDRPDSVGDLLVKALRRMNVEGIVHGIVTDPVYTIREIVRHNIDCLVGIPTQVLSLVRNDEALFVPYGRIKSVLLSSDYVSPAIAREVNRIWGCQVFNHYGTTEMGFGGGVECTALRGYHLREADLYFEIVNPSSGEPLPTGDRGEIVFTTLTRKGMPLIRYRTGDLARFLLEPCLCGSALRRLDTVRGRLNDFVKVGASHWLSITDFDDVLFPVPGLLDFEVSLTDHDNVNRLDIVVHGGSCEDETLLSAIRAALMQSEVLCKAIQDGCVSLGSIVLGTERPLTTGTAKRGIRDRRAKEGTLNKTNT
jgi:phenylacetate-coenzyme A ligase PaaK-like adenylate-forming protein